jgi:hypothetical protein
MVSILCFGVFPAGQRVPTSEGRIVSEYAKDFIGSERQALIYFISKETAPLMDTKIVIPLRLGRFNPPPPQKKLLLEEVDLQLSFSVKCCFDELSPQKSLQLQVMGWIGL